VKIKPGPVGLNAGRESHPGSAHPRAFRRRPHHRLTTGQLTPGHAAFRRRPHHRAQSAPPQSPVTFVT
jgi:hypothetical protein